MDDETGCRYDESMVASSGQVRESRFLGSERLNRSITGDWNICFREGNLYRIASESVMT